MTPGDEGELLDQIVEKIRKLMHELNVHVADFHPFVGIDSRVHEVISLLTRGGDDNDDVRIVTVYGPKGIGKTTIAKATYDFFSINFNAQDSCFINDVKTVFGRPNGKVILQEQLLSNLLHNESQTFVDNYHQGIRKIEKRINNQKVFLVFDNVDMEEQLQILGINRALLGRGSRIIVTTRKESIVRWLEPDATYKPRKLDESESTKVLCVNAFGQDNPKEGYEELSREAVCWSAGRPGALKDLGEELRSYRSVEIWRKALKSFMYNSPWSSSLGATNC